jgi:hypothetical protein
MPACRARRSAVAAIASLVVSLPAQASLLVHEPFDYAAGTVLDGTPATGQNLTGAWVPLGPAAQQKLVVAAPGLDYGNLVGPLAPSGQRLTDLAGVTAAGGTVAVDDDVLVPAGSAIYWSALMRFDDSENGNHLVSITLSDETTGDSIGFGEGRPSARARSASSRTPPRPGSSLPTERITPSSTARPSCCWAAT